MMSYTLVTWMEEVFWHLPRPKELRWKQIATIHKRLVYVAPVLRFLAVVST